MGQSDLKLRNKAIPFQGQIFAYNSSEKSSQKISQANNVGDLYFLALQQAGNTLKYYPIRFLRPFGGQITQAYLTLDIKVGTSQSGPLKVYVGAPVWMNDSQPYGEFSEADGVMEARIKAQHKQLTGSAAAFQANPGSRIQVTALNIARIIPADMVPPAGSKYFFSVALLFETAPDQQNGWEVNKFKIDAAVNMGL